jgi:acetylornithine deacetylase/succinyl-diaminopimelate desuccinylase-like protein
MPVNLTMLIEGEEEIGSENLAEFCETAEAAFTRGSVPHQRYRSISPRLTCHHLCLRGLVYEEVKITGPINDLHSGGYGGAVPNPANVLCEILASLHNTDGSVNIPGFYEDVAPLSNAEKQLLRKLPHDDKDFARQLGLSELSGEKGFTTLERIAARPPATSMD